MGVNMRAEKIGTRATAVIAVLLFASWLPIDAACGEPPADGVNSKRTLLATLRGEVEQAVTDGKLADRWDELAASARKLIEGEEDVSDRLSAIKVAGRLCWDGPVEKTNALREFALEKLVQLAEKSQRARVMLVDQFLPPLHHVAADQRAAMLESDDGLTEKLRASVSDLTTQDDLRLRQCMARIEADRAWNCPWMDAPARQRVDTWLAALAESDGDAPAGGAWRDIIPTLREEWKRSPYGFDLSDVSAPDLQGATTWLRDFRGKVVILSFWSSWCVPCLELAPEEAKLVERLGDKAVLVGVNADATTAQARRTAAAHHMTWPQVWSPPETENSLVSLLRIQQWPSAVVLDREGAIQARFVGSVYQGRLTMAEVEKAVREILARGSRGNE